MGKISLKNEIRQKILDKIITMDFTLDTVITEGKLIEMFQVSKSPVREALLELCNENILISMPRYGYKIIPLSRKDIEDAIEVRLLIEIFALEQIITNIDSEKISLLKEHNAHHANQLNVKDGWVQWQLNSEFHLMLMSFAENQLMYRILNKTLGILSRAFAQYYTEKWQNITANMDVERHTDIISLIESKEFDKAVQRLREDITFIGEELGIYS